MSPPPRRFDRRSSPALKEKDEESKATGAERMDQVRKARKNRRNKTGWTKKRAKVLKGFSAFNVEQTVIADDGKEIHSTQVIAPETGIHSRAWAAAIEPQQPNSFLGLPIEVRHNIYELALQDSVVDTPRKNGAKYTTAKGNSATITMYNNLCTLSRQVWVDIVGGGLLYSFARFAFSSPSTMIRYLACINPAHKDQIRKVGLHISLTESSPYVPAITWSALASLPSLQSLKVTMGFKQILCSHGHHVPNRYHQRWERYVVRDWVMVKLRKHLNDWEAVHGLEHFELVSQGTPELWRKRASLAYFGKDWSTYFDENEENFVKYAEKIKAIVTRT